MENNGFVAKASAAGALPAEIRYVVVIVKENRTYDEVLGDIAQSANGAVAGLASLARFGRSATVTADRRVRPAGPTLTNVT